MRIKSIGYVICFIAFGLYSCQKGNDDTKDPAAPNPSPTPAASVNRTTFIQLVNNVRQAGCTCGSSVMPPVAPVTWNDLLANAALSHSSDMNTNDYFSHTGLNGSSAGDRITAAGYNWRAYGENIARGYTSEQAVMDGWLKSEGHCKNIMSSQFKEMGVGRAGNYWTQAFGSR